MENRYDELCEAYEEQFCPDGDFAKIENDITHLLVFADWLIEYDDSLAEYLRVLCDHMKEWKTDIDTAITYEEQLEECESEYIEPEHYRLYVDHVGIDFASIEDFQDKFQGEWGSLADYVEDWFEQTGELQKSDNWFHPSNYTDWEKMGDDLAMSGDIFTCDLGNGSILVFFNH